VRGICSPRRIGYNPSGLADSRIEYFPRNKFTLDTEAMRFNTAISAMKEFNNFLTKQEVRPKSVLKDFVLLLAPYAPHIAEEL
jgi:leucyl-tRNA synthetase